MKKIKIIQEILDNILKWDYKETDNGKLNDIVKTYKQWDIYNWNLDKIIEVFMFLNKGFEKKEWVEVILTPKWGFWYIRGYLDWVSDYNKK